MWPVIGELVAGMECLTTFRRNWIMSLFGRFIVYITCRLHVHVRWRKATGYSEIKTEYRWCYGWIQWWSKATSRRTAFQMVHYVQRRRFCWRVAINGFIVSARPFRRKLVWRVHTTTCNLGLLHIICNSFCTLSISFLHNILCIFRLIL